MYEKAKLECLCYETLSEKHAEKYHVTEDVLAQMNPGVQLNGLGAGDSLSVPDVEQPAATPAETPATAPSSAPSGSPPPAHSEGPRAGRDVLSAQSLPGPGAVFVSGEIGLHGSA